MNPTRPTQFATLAVAATLLTGLVACHALPLPIEIDLLPELAEARSGVVAESVLQGVDTHLLMNLPSQDGDCLDVDANDIPVSVVHAQLSYAIALHFAGPALSGVVEIQPYLAPSRSTQRTESTAFGDRQTVDLASTRVELDAVARLTTEQVAALNGGRLCWGLRLRGTDLAAAANGTVRLTYEIRRLSIRAGLAVF